MSYTWRCGVVTFGRTERRSALAHLVAPSGRTACGAKLNRSAPEPKAARQIRCERCIEARSRGAR